MQTAAAPLPLIMPNLLYWLDASDPNNDGTWNADTASMASWSDKSFYRRGQSQGTGANQPTFQANSNRDMPGVFFDGTSDGMLTAAAWDFLLGNPGFEIYFAGEIDVDGAGGYPILFGYGTPTAGGNAYQFGAQDTNANLFLGWYTFGPYGGYPSDTFQLANVLRTGGGNSDEGNVYYLNGVSQTFTDAGTGTPNVISGPLYVGANYTTSGGYCNCTIQELIIYSAPLIVAQRETVTNYLYNKWGI